MGKKLKIMIVDDNKTMRTIINEICLTYGFNVVGMAENGKEAVKLYNEVKPDIVTMDILMPEMNGLEAIRRIRFNDDEAKIIVISSLSEKKEMKKCLLSGASYYMIKPFEPDKFIEICEGVLKGNININSLFN